MSMVDIKKSEEEEKTEGEKEFTQDELNELPAIPDMDENEGNNPNDDSGIRESIKDFFNNEEDMKNREPEFTANFAEE